MGLNSDVTHHAVPTDGVRLLLLGATGAVGQQVLRQALADARVVTVLAPTRRSLPGHAKLENPLTDFSPLADDASYWSADAVVCALGTTIKIAGSRSAFAAIDRDLPMAIAARARAAGARTCVLNSSLGASRSGTFYLHTKAEVEDGIRQLHFPSYTIVRPSLIDAQRTESRPGEVIGLAMARLLGPLVPRHYRPVKCDAIARTLLRSAVDPQPGEHIIESEAIAG